ncbi:zinc finger A20 and AN1 domain-containing stress-associated protein 1-like [Malania oleifera]|uniref:zinc finger A20 and AN1 domain-containing stress-associated protein 1-like n=1 Tax=Malania oleifera TaxID=397392 RepID=UPI0025AE0223|nr:zinc finger A20 and AN1 domain-containing stress-associated protein 1-like [Malania oleifera]
MTDDVTGFKHSERALYANRCGFFGSVASMNLCLKCYRDLRIKEVQAASAKAAIDTTLFIKTKEDDILLETLMDFKCRCGITFCGADMYSEDHGGSFGFKGAGKDAIAAEGGLSRQAAVAEAATVVDDEEHVCGEGCVRSGCHPHPQHH